MLAVIIVLNNKTKFSKQAFFNQYELFKFMRFYRNNNIPFVVKYYNDLDSMADALYNLKYNIDYFY